MLYSTPALALRLASSSLGRIATLPAVGLRFGPLCMASPNPTDSAPRSSAAPRGRLDEGDLGLREVAVTAAMAAFSPKAERIWGNLREIPLAPSGPGNDINRAVRSCATLSNSIITIPY